MSNEKVIICTTLRDFTGSENDEIQIRFLESLLAQTYEDIEFIVTLFGEKNVETTVKKYIPNAFFYNGKADDFRYSLSEVLNNAIQYAKDKKYKKFSVLWTTCDVLYAPNFIEVCSAHSIKKRIITSHPHKVVSTNNFNIDILQDVSGLGSGFDMIYMTSDFLEQEDVQKALSKYIYTDWGIFEHFLIALSRLCKDVRLINVCEESQVKKIENDRQITNDSNSFLMGSHKKNSVVLSRFLTDFGLSTKFFNLIYCHLNFNLTKNKILHYMNFRADIYQYCLYSFKRLMSSFLPVQLKKFLKGCRK